MSRITAACPFPINIRAAKCTGCCAKSEPLPPCVLDFFVKAPTTRRAEIRFFADRVLTTAA